ncbi:MAG TPA: hypothetical protein PKJ17_01505 [Syntrophorhabdaceae bacterium]|nr:hypothetical protein [Syntrophorhabdaceae bacterium]
MRKEHFLVGLSIALYLFGHLALVWNLEPAISFFYVTSWWSYIILLDSFVSWKTGEPLFLNRSLPAVIIVSCGYWCAFELLNLRIENWFYINVPHAIALRYAGYLLAYGTVIPAIGLTAAIASPLLGRIRVRPVTTPRSYPARAISCGIALFLLTLIFPGYLFGLAWVFATPLIDGVNYRAGYRSFMGDLERGQIGRLLGALASGLVCGLLWETWNSLSPVKWVYTVPFFERMKIFEMPLPGYIGFPVFGVETVAFLDLFEGLRRKKSLAALTLCGALLTSVLSFSLIDRHTVFSRTTPVEQLLFLSRKSKDALLTKGVRTNLTVDTSLLGPGEAQRMRLVNLRGLGYENYLKLEVHGITSVDGLARLDETRLAQMLGEKNLLRIHIYQSAARPH